MYVQSPMRVIRWRYIMIKHKKYKLFLPVNVVFIICQKAFFCKSYSLENSNLMHLLQSILEKVAAVYAYHMYAIYVYL